MVSARRFGWRREFTARTASARLMMSGKRCLPRRHLFLPSAISTPARVNFVSAPVPASVNEEVARRAADNGVLVAERVGGRWFCTTDHMETWLKRTGRWFRSEAEEQRWRKMLVNRKVQ
jgi:hypothetical protein